MNWIGTPLGPMIALCDACSLQLLEFADQKILRSEMIKLFEYCKVTIQFGETPKTALIKSELQQYFARNLPSFTVPLALHRSEFLHAVGMLYEIFQQAQPAVMVTSLVQLTNPAPRVPWRVPTGQTKLKFPVIG